MGKFWLSLIMCLFTCLSAQSQTDSRLNGYFLFYTCIEKVADDHFVRQEIIVHLSDTSDECVVELFHSSITNPQYLADVFSSNKIILPWHEWASRIEVDKKSSRHSLQWFYAYDKLIKKIGSQQPLVKYNSSMNDFGNVNQHEIKAEIYKIDFSIDVFPIKYYGLNKKEYIISSLHLILRPGQSLVEGYVLSDCCS